MNNIHVSNRKPNTNPLYIHTSSNHPPSIIKHIPSSIEKRVNINSTNEENSMNSNFYKQVIKISDYKCPNINYITK